METLSGSCKKTKVSCTGRPPSVRSIYSWSRRSHHCTEPYTSFNIQNIFKVMFWTRSDYFRALIDDHFHEGSFDKMTHRLVITINNISPEVFAIVVSHIYSNVQQVIIDNSLVCYRIPSKTVDNNYNQQ